MSDDKINFLLENCTVYVCSNCQHTNNDRLHDLTPSINKHFPLKFKVKFKKNLSDYSSRFHTNVQLPSCKTHSLHNSLFYKGSQLWNSLPT